MVQDWDIKPRSEACCGCMKPFAEQETCFSSLVFGDDGYRRIDYCEKCWSQRAETGEFYSAWQGVFRIPPPQPEEVLKKETAESLLRHLMEEEDTTNTNVIYILAVMLERKRTFVERDVQRHDGKIIRVYEHRKTGETFLIRDPGLRLDQLEEVQQQVVSMLGGQQKTERGAGWDNVSTSK